MIYPVAVLFSLLSRPPYACRLALAELSYRVLLHSLCIMGIVRLNIVTPAPLAAVRSHLCVHRNEWGISRSGPSIPFTVVDVSFDVSSRSSQEELSPAAHPECSMRASSFRALLHPLRADPRRGPSTGHWNSPPRPHRAHVRALYGWSSGLTTAKAPHRRSHPTARDGAKKIVGQRAQTAHPRLLPPPCVATLLQSW